MKELLLDGFHYDDWANQRWLEALAHFPQGHRALAVFEHLLWAQGIWLSRCKGLGNIPPAGGSPNLDDLRSRLNSLQNGWIDWLNSAELPQIIQYSNTGGEVFTREASQIAWHVLNHGTYHRGQLRQLAEDARMDFPDSDFIYSPFAKTTGTI